MRLAIVGAGWAGLSAATRAADLGYRVTVLEASRILGGRARAVMSPRLKTRIDNGQHIMLGAYDATFALMKRLGVDTSKTLQHETLVFESADGSFRLALPRLPAPFHLAMALLGARGLFVRDKIELARILRRLQKDGWHTPPGATVQQWLDRHGQSARVRALFWTPLCVAALNTPVNTACAQLFANVLRDSLGAAPEACDVVLSRVDLSALWPDQVQNLRPATAGGHIEIRRGCPVRHLALNTHPADTNAATGAPHSVSIDGEVFDGVIIAANAPSARRLLAQLPVKPALAAARAALLQSLSAFQYVPIATVTLQLEQSWTLPRSMYLLHENRRARHFGQWLFNCPAFMVDASAPLLQIVISDAADALAAGEQELIRGLQDQLRMQTQRFGPMPAIRAWELIAEKRATFAATPGLARPGASTPWAGVWLAGDWTDTGYPAVLEGAVRSGHEAVMAMHQASAGAGASSARRA